MKRKGKRNYKGRKRGVQ